MSMAPSRTGPNRDPDEEDLQPFEGWTFATDEDGDLIMTNANRLATVTDARAVRQCLLVSIASIKGEDPLDEDFGIDLFVATRSIPHLQRELARAMVHDSKDHDRVASVNDIEVQMRGHRDANVEISVTLESGDIEVITIDIGGVYR